jgi:nucleolar GTP-binding protein
MSCATKEGVDCVRAKACELLLTQRVDNKVKQNRSENIKNRIHIAAPTTVRTINGGAIPTSNQNSNQVASMIRQERPAMIPESVLKMRKVLEVEESKLNEDKLKSDLERKEALNEKKKEIQNEIAEENNVEIELEKDLMEERGGAGVYRVDQNKSFLLADEEWKYDSLPEFMDGHNVADFVDPGKREFIDGHNVADFVDPGKKRYFVDPGKGRWNLGSFSCMGNARCWSISLNSEKLIRTSHRCGRY